VAILGVAVGKSRRKNLVQISKFLHRETASIGPAGNMVQRLRAGRPASRSLTKFQRYRRAQADKGMKLLRIWVSDSTRPEFAKEAARQARLLRRRPEEAEALAFIEAAFPWPDTKSA
jgi:hypothetical protein